MNLLQTFFLSLLTALFFSNSTHANKPTLMLEDVPQPSVLAVDSQTGLPTTIGVNRETISVDGEISRIVFRDGKVVGYFFGQEFQGTTYVRDAAGAYQWVMRDGGKRVIGISPISVHRSANIDFTLQYMVEDAESWEAIKRSVSEQNKAERAAQKSYVQSLKRPAEQSAERSSLQSLKSAGGCQINCDADRDIEVARCDTSFNMGNNACDLASSVPIVGPAFTFSCKNRVAGETQMCKIGVADRWRGCSMRCQGFVFNVE